MRRFHSLPALLLPLTILATTSACGGEASTAPPAKARVSESKPAATPRCASTEDSQPTDANSKMTGLQHDLRSCFALGTTGSLTSTLRLEVTVAESGDVKAVKISADGAQPAAKECSEKLVRATKFSKFCGDDVGISWVYTLE